MGVGKVLSAAALLLWLALVPASRAACADNPAQMAAFAALAGISNVTSCAVVAGFCANLNFGSYVRTACPATCGLCPPPDACTGALQPRCNSWCLLAF